MNTTPVFSIILPIYKVERYLHQCVDSILGQTYKNFELILVDDGSPDRCPQICDDYASKDERVKVIHKENGGLSDARNKGLLHAIGDYIFFIDSDDYLANEKVLEAIVSKVGNIDVVLFKFRKYYENTKVLTAPPFSFPRRGTCSSTVEWLIEMNNKDAFYNSAWSKVIKRELLISKNIQFQKGLLGEDNDWFYQVLLYAKNFDYIDEPFIVYRQRNNSITSSYKLKNLVDLIYILNKWVAIVNSAKANPYTSVIEASLAKQYSHALIGYQMLKDPGKKAYKDVLKKHSRLLNCSNNPRVRLFRRVYNAVGFNGTIFLLKLVSVALQIRRRVS